MNHLTIAGHLGSDPEVRMTPNGAKVTSFRVATKTRKAGKDDTIWWKVSAWGDQFDKMMTFLKKGSAVIITGEMSKPEIFTDRDGQPQVSVGLTANSISFSPFGRLEGKTEGAEGAGFRNNYQPNNQQSNSYQGSSGSKGTAFEPEFVSSAMNDDDIPF